jgi:tetratricopeptide (TPR) repeat protein
LSPAITASIQAEGNDHQAAAQESLVRELIASKQSDKALPHVIRRLLHLPLDPEALGHAAECLRLQGRHRESAGFLKTLSRLQPADPQTFYLLGMALLCDRAPADAIPFLRKAVELSQDSHLSWRGLAMGLLQDSQHEAAVAALIGSTLAAAGILASKYWLIDARLAPNLTFIPFVTWTEVLIIVPILYLVGVGTTVLAASISLRRYLKG